MSRRIILFTSLPRVGGHSTLTYGLCRMLRPHFDEIEVWCKTMPEHEHSAAVAGKIEELGCKVLLISDEQGKVLWPVLFSAVVRARKNRPAVFFTLAMRHLSALLAPLVSAKNSIYYHITHDLNAGTIKRLDLYAKVFRKVVFICPATYDDFPGASTDPQFTWVPQSSEIPVREPEKLAGEREIALGNASRPIRFGLIGRLTEDKGSAAMIEFIDTTKVACELHVAGVGPFADAFKERASRTGPAVVKFLGAFDPADREAFLRKYFADIDLLLVPSQDAWETLSMATLESLQHGVPAMLCSTGGLVSFVHPQLGPAPEDVVRLVDPKEYAGVLEKLAAKPRRPQAAVVQECRDYYERFFNDPAVLQKWLNVLNG
jgi:glycosyltransferase involved in cell wall biosynthesis